MRNTLNSFFVLLFAALLIQCSEKSVGSLSSTLSNELAYFPANSNGLMYVNVERIRTSAFLEALTDSIDQKLESEEGYQEFLQATGLDLHKDVGELLVAFHSPEEAAKKSGLLVALGTFDPEKLVAFVRQKDDQGELQSEMYQGVELFYSGDMEGNGFCFPDNKHVVAGGREMVQTWLDNHSAGGNGFAGTRLAESLGKLRFTDTFWAVLDASSMMDELMTQMTDRDLNRLAAVRSIKEVQISMDISSALRIDGNGEFDSGEKAELFRDAIKGLLAAAKLSVSSDREAVDIMNKIDIEQNGSNVNFFMEMSRQDIDKLKEKRAQGFAMKL